MDCNQSDIQSQDSLEVSSQIEETMDMHDISEEGRSNMISRDDKKSNPESNNVVVHKEERLNKSMPNLGGDNTNDTDDFIQSIWNQQESTDVSTTIVDYNKDNDREKSNDDITFGIVKDNNNLWNETTNVNSNAQILEDSISKHFACNKNIINDEFANDLWNNDATTNNEVNFTKSPIVKNQTSNDFFSVILSNGISSPSSEMEHLRLSSPENNQEITKSNHVNVNEHFSKIQSNEINNVTSNHELNNRNNDGNFDENNSNGSSNNLSSLQSINEDSLKELLNCIVDK